MNYIFRLVEGSFNCEQFPEDINVGLFVFLSRADKENDKELRKEGVYRNPMDLRPPTLKNSGNKIVAGIIQWIIEPVVEGAACTPQIGFAGGRQLIQNVVDLDFTLRRDSLLYQQAMDDGNICLNHDFSSCSCLSVVHRDLLNSIPITILFDFAMAFPSVSRAWVFFLLCFMGAQKGIMDVISVLYKMNEACMNTPNRMVFMLIIFLLGVVRGCPSSGSLSVISTLCCTCSKTNDGPPL